VLQFAASWQLIESKYVEARTTGVASTQSGNTAAITIVQQSNQAEGGGCAIGG